MKKLITMAIMMAVAISATAMSYKRARNEALFLSDKMAYELDLTDAQYDAVYEINLDYLLSMNVADDVLGPWWDRRNVELRYVLEGWQYDRYIGLQYFYHPLAWSAGAWMFNIYAHYTDPAHFFRARPSVFLSYRGGNRHRPATWRQPTPAAHRPVVVTHRPIVNTHHPAVNTHRPTVGTHQPIASTGHSSHTRPTTAGNHGGSLSGGTRNFGSQPTSGSRSFGGQSHGSGRSFGSRH